MFRKLALAVVAVASMTAAVPASAHGFGGGHFGGGGGFHGGFHGGGHFHGGGFVISTGYAAPYSCYRIVYADFGPRRVNVCY
jgi:opacity protein-like surface antigen